MRVRIELTEHGHRLVFEIADDGQGYDTQVAAASGGVQNMTDRIGALGGQLNVHSVPGSGTRILGSVPRDM
ncbi:MAG: hypothetical protein M3Y17_05865 [Actinomycetota bacterium]|nr:hypothetical protein [Actinomycetota bacterium]